MNAQRIVWSPQTHTLMNMNGKPWFDWYKWRNKYWDTKWDAYEQSIYVNPDSIEFEFQTAWSSPMPVIEKLKLLGYNMEYAWADEDWGSNCGKGIYNPEKTGFNDWLFTYESELEDPRRFAVEVWGYDYDEILEEEKEDK